MTWKPIAFLPPQYENASGIPYSGAVLKAYAAGTNTPIPFATDYTGVTTTSSVILNASGFTTYNSTVIIPHVQENYDLALYPNQAAADADSGAIWTVPNVQIADLTNTSFVQYFDGNGSQTAFTLSQDFGTDENILMIFADRQLPNYVTNGSFSADTNWTKGSGWTIGAGVATATGAISTALTQTSALPLLTGQSYTITYTITASAGNITPTIGGNTGTARSSGGTYTETIVAGGSNQTIGFNTSGFTGTVDNVSIKPTYGALRQILRPLDEYTINGNALTLVEAPPSGTKNIIVFAPSQLLGAANNAAAAAATSETNAAASATAAASSATAAAASATSAASSATTATTQASNASTSATAAAASATSAANSNLFTNTTQSGTTYTLALADQNTMVDLTNASGCNVTVPPNSSVAFPVGAQILLRHDNAAGQSQLTAGSGVTINSAYGMLKIEGTQYAMIHLLKIATNVWQATGRLVP